MTKYLYLEIPGELYDEIDTYAFMQKLSKKQVVINALTAFFKNEKNPARAKSATEIINEIK